MLSHQWKPLLWDEGPHHMLGPWHAGCRGAWGKASAGVQVSLPEAVSVLLQQFSAQAGDLLGHRLLAAWKFQGCRSLRKVSWGIVRGSGCRQAVRFRVPYVWSGWFWFLFQEKLWDRSQ